METAAPLLFDTHVHLDLPPLVEELPCRLQEARQAGVGGFVLPGVHRRDWPGLLATAGRIPGGWAAPGLHPAAAAEWDAGAARQLAELLHHPRVAAVGEIGLDALPGLPPREMQERALRAQLRLALEAGRPVLIHCRRASGPLLALLGEEGAPRVGGILHAFSGSVETARAAVRLGFAIGFGGSLTYPGARRAPEVLCALPAEAIVLETDAPDLAPHPHRGEANRPAWLTLVAARVAQLRGWTLEETARITTGNARRVLRLGER